MMFLLGKLLTLLVFLRYPFVDSQYRWFIRFRYLGLIRQLKYFIKDYIVRKPYKEIAFVGEFQQELLHVVPFAYWHYCNGTLKSTTSSLHTRELYFFSPDHTELDQKRDYKDNFNIEIPNAPHDLKLLKYKWKAVPLKKHFENKVIEFDKPILVVANRYNTEWENDPISFFDLEILDEIFSLLKKDYQIIYNRPPAKFISNDSSEVKELGDYNWIKVNHPYVKQVVDLYTELHDKVSSYNHLQLLIYANCSNFISIHGGTATLASAFGGNNIIYSKQGHEHYLKEFDRVFPVLSSARIFPVRDYSCLLDKVCRVYLNQ